MKNYTMARRFLAVTCLATASAVALAQQVRPSSAADGTEPTTPTPIETRAAPAAEADDVVVLSPFEVVSDTKGYYAANTMSGTRFNSRLEDLGSSITVVTKEQMNDFAMLDINDVFMYTANTEGTGTYTDYVMDRNGQMNDNSQGNPTQANRVRGISAANQAYGNFEILGRMPIDPLNVDGIEVSRGPNASVFGLGDPSGTVNQVPASANLQRNRAQAQYRVDSYDGFRASLDVNQVIFKDKLAVRASTAYQHEAYVRGPSGVNTNRYNFMVKYQPFKSTSISASYISHRANGNRPNNTPPRDYVSYWLESGKPSWNPITQQITLNGKTFGPDGTSNTRYTTDAMLPDYFNRGGGHFTRSNVFVDQTGLTYWTMPTNNTAATPLSNTGSGANFLRLMGPSAMPGSTLGRSINQPLFATTPAVSDQSIYDWSSINLSSPNKLYDRNEMYLVQLDQVFINTQRQTLAAQAAVFREDSEQIQYTPFGNAGISGQTGQLWVDVNEYNLDGSANPYFGRLYMGVIEPRTYRNPSRWDTGRTQLAYRLDLTNESNWLKWLGQHQFSGYNEYKQRINRSYTYRSAINSNHSWLPATTARGNANNLVKQFYRYYVSDSSPTVEYAPANFDYGSYSMLWGTTGNWRNEQADLALVPSGNNATKTIVKTNGGIVQSHFLGGKLVTTVGARQDKVYSKTNNTTSILRADNVDSFNYEAADHFPKDYRYASGRTKTFSVVARPFRDLGFVTRAAEGTGFSALFGDFMRGLSFTYSKSDNFVVAPPAVDLYMQQLPNTTGKGKDYGFAVNMMDGRLVLRVNRYETNQYNRRDGDANTIAQRVLRMDLDISGDAYQLYDNALVWWGAANPGWTTEQARAAALDQMKMTDKTYTELYDAFQAGTIAATNDIVAKGTEIELNYNPTRYWTVAMNATETKAINTNISTTIQQWIDERMPIWTTVVDKTDGNLWWTNTRYGGAQTAAQNFASFVEAPYAILRESQGKSRPQVRQYAYKLSTNYQLAGITDRPILKSLSIGGAVRWEDEGAIGYYGIQNASGIYTKLDVNKPIWDEDHYYFDAFVGYRTKFFGDRIDATFRLNVRNIQEGGRLQPIGAFPDGTPHSYRIVDPRQFILTASFDL